MYLELKSKKKLSRKKIKYDKLVVDKSLILLFIIHQCGANFDDEIKI